MKGTYMNIENLHRLIDRYEEQIALINNSENNEIFKWRAVKCFRDVWFSESARSMPFSEMFSLAKKESSVLVNNSRVYPADGIVKLAEKEPETVEWLFREVLPADDGGDLTVRQNHMEEFLEQIECLRLKYFPQHWKYKQDRHAVSCYMVFLNPEDNYIYRYSDAETFAQYIEYGIDIGSGESFRLDAYYKMCDLIVEALRKHDSLLRKHFDYLSDRHYRDDSLHLLVFDLMYCARTYGLYTGLSHASKKQSIRAYTEAQLREKTQQEKIEKIDALNAEISELEIKTAEYADISLLNVQVYQNQYGNGIVIEQDINKLTIRFADCSRVFVINRNYLGRPKFEDDKDIVDAFTEYDEICKRVRALKEQLKRLMD